MSKFHKIVFSAAVAAAFVPAAFADSGATWVGGEVGFVSHPVQSTTTREQVRAELKTFQREGGQLARGELSLMPRESFQSTKTREQVRAELMTFQREGGQLARGEHALMAHEHTYKMQNGVTVHTDPYGTMGNAPAPAGATRR